MRFVTVDAKHTLSLDLPGGVPPPKAGVVSGQTLVLLKDLGDGRGGGDDDEGGGAARASAAVLLETGLGDAAATGKRLTEALAAADDFPAGLTRLTKRPSLKSRTPPPTPPRAQTYEREAPKEEPASRTYTTPSYRSASASPRRRGARGAAPRRDGGGGGAGRQRRRGGRGGGRHHGRRRREEEDEDGEVEEMELDEDWSVDFVLPRHILLTSQVALSASHSSGCRPRNAMRSSTIALLLVLHGAAGSLSGYEDEGSVPPRRPRTTTRPPREPRS